MSRREAGVLPHITSTSSARFLSEEKGTWGLTKLPHQEGNVRARVRVALLAAPSGPTARKDEPRARPGGLVPVVGLVSSRCCGGGWRKEEGAPVGPCPVASTAETPG